MSAAPGVLVGDRDLAVMLARDGDAAETAVSDREQPACALQRVADERRHDARRCRERSRGGRRRQVCHFGLRSLLGFVFGGSPLGGSFITFYDPRWRRLGIRFGFVHWEGHLDSGVADGEGIRLDVPAGRQVAQIDIVGALQAPVPFGFVAELVGDASILAAARLRGHERPAEWSGFVHESGALAGTRGEHRSRGDGRQGKREKSGEYRALHRAQAISQMALLAVGTIRSNGSRRRRPSLQPPTRADYERPGVFAEVTSPLLAQWRKNLSVACTSRGRANRKPCPLSQLSPCSSDSSWCSSMPSANVSIESALPSCTRV